MSKNNIVGGLYAVLPYGVAIFAQIYFARYLSADEFGRFAVINLFFGLALIMTNWSGDKYIISKPTLTSDSINQIFTFELGLGLLLYGLIYCFFSNQINEVSNFTIPLKYQFISIN